MRLNYLGHSCFLIEAPQGRLLIDPFLTHNPSAAVSAAEVACDFILLSHGHDDHVGDAAAISKRTGAPVICNFELSEFLSAQGVKVEGLNPGGGADFPFGRVKLTIAHHSSSQVETGGKITYLGSPCGLLIHIGGKVLYKTEDLDSFIKLYELKSGGLA